VGIFMSAGISAQTGKLNNDTANATTKLDFFISISFVYKTVRAKCPDRVLLSMRH
jgi:hypothetical protein